METIINFSKSKEKQIGHRIGGGSYPRNRPIRILSNPNLRKDLFALYKGHFNRTHQSNQARNFFCKWDVKSGGQVRRFGWFERTNTHQHAPYKMDGWMDGWMDGVWTGNTLFHCTPVPWLTTVVSYVLTIHTELLTLIPTKCITYLPTYLPTYLHAKNLRLLPMSCL